MHAELGLPLGMLFGFLAVLARVSTALAFVPLPGLTAAPGMVRAVLAVSLTVVLAPLWPEVAPAEFAAGRILILLLSEAALGITIGLAVAFLIETLLFASQVFGVQAGYSYASTIDPNTQADSGVLTVFAELMSGMIFFSLGLDREVLRAFAASLRLYPPGTFLLKAPAAEAVIALGANMLTTGVRMALPMVALLMLVDMALALLGRMHQQLQLLSLAFPVKMLATLAFLAAISALFVPVYRGAAERTIAALFRLFQRAHGG